MPTRVRTRAELGEELGVELGPMAALTVTLTFSTFKTKIVTVTTQLNSTEDELNDCFHNSHKLELDANKNVRQWSEQRKELNEKIEAARDQIGLAFL